MESQLSVIQNILNTGKWVSKITSNQFFPYFLFLQPHIILFHQGTQRGQKVSAPWTPPPWGWLDQPQTQTKGQQEHTLCGMHCWWKLGALAALNPAALQQNKPTVHSDPSPPDLTQLTQTFLASREVWSLHQCAAICLPINKVETHGKLPSNS